jgi:DNA polymerase-3 subunit alpha
LQEGGRPARQARIEIDLDALPWDDSQVYDLLQRGDTVGVFQLESEGMRRTLAAVKPTNFGDIIALVSLYRPGPMDNIPLFGRRKNGLKRSNTRTQAEGILAETYGVFVYQEQVMQAAQILAGYSLGDADLLRRAMGKKVQAEMDAQRQRFVDGCKTVSGIDAKKANELFDLIDKFAGYGFNKSHAAAYALLAYQTAWLKTHYPHEFYAASMCFDMHQSEKLAVFVDDMRRARRRAGRRAGHQPHRGRIHRRADRRWPCRALCLGGHPQRRRKGDGRRSSPSARRTALRQSGRPVPPRARRASMNRRQLEGLAGAGAFDSLEPNRAQVLANADMLLAVADEAARSRTSGQAALFGGDDHAAGAAPGRRRAVVTVRADGQGARELRLLFRRASGRGIPCRSPRPTARAPCQPDGGGTGEAAGRSPVSWRRWSRTCRSARRRRARIRHPADFSDSRANSRPPALRKAGRAVSAMGQGRHLRLAKRRTRSAQPGRSSARHGPRRAAAGVSDQAHRACN